MKTILNSIRNYSNSLIHPTLYRTLHRTLQQTIALAISMALVFAPLQSNAQPGSDQAENLAGHIIVVSGEVIARDATGSSRELSRRSSIYVGDTVFTAPSSSTQIRMIDRALISLKESTEFAIVAYEFEDNPETDTSSLDLIQGGFRTITGLIGEQNRAAYTTRVSEYSTIGIRGTDYEVVITAQGEIITGVYDGGTTIANDAGDLDLGIGADYDFALVPDADTPPQGLVLQPVELGAIALTISADSDDEEDQTQDADDSDGGSDGNTDGGNDDGNDQAADGANADDQADDGATDNNADTADNDGDNGGGNAVDDNATDNTLATTADTDGSSDQNASTSTSDTNSDLAANLAPPSATQLAETPNTVVSETVVSTSEQAQTTEVVLNPSETGGDGSIACSADSTSCTVLEEVLDDAAKQSDESADGTVTGGISSLNVSNLSDRQIKFLDSLGLTPDAASGNIDISSLSPEQFTALRTLTERNEDGGTGGVTLPDTIANLPVSDLTADQVSFLRSLGIAGSANGLVDVSSLNDEQLTRLKALGEESNDDIPGDGNTDNGRTTIDVRNLSDSQVEFLKTLGFAAENGVIDISRLNDEQLEKFKALAAETDGSPTDGTPPDGNTNGDSQVVDVSRLSDAQIEFLKSLGLTADNGFVDISRLSDEQLKRLESLSDNTDPGTDIPTSDNSRIDIRNLSEKQVEFLRSLGLGEEDGFIDVSKLSEEQLKELESLTDNTQPDGNTPPSGATTVDVRQLSEAQIEFLKSLGLTENDGLIDLSNLSDEQIERFKSLADDTGTGTTNPPASGNTVNVANLSDAQVEFLKSLGLTAKDGVVDISRLSNEEIERFKLLADSSGSGTSGTNTKTVEISSLNDAQIEFLKSLGLTAKDGVIDVSSLTDEQLKQLEELAAKANLTFTSSTIDSANIRWGKWDNPLDSNWVVVQEIDDGLVRISTNDFFAEVTPTPIANLSGSHSYRTGISSAFIGTGSGGDVSSLVAGMDVDFDTGAIDNGSLQVLAGEQSWTVQFDGLVRDGAVDLNSIGGHLIDGSGLLSDSIEANLGGAFTGNQAEAFVGGFDLLDAVNELNHVNGLFTIER